MKIRKLFTGNLGANVACYPAFPGAEAEYLRAQIARIGQATVVVPQGRIIVDEESEAEPKPLIANPEYAVPESLPGIESWAHGYGGILKIGRCTNVPKPPLADGEEEAEAEELEDEVPPLGSVADDAPVVLFSEEEGDNLPAWSTALHNTLAPAYAVAVAKSNRWPGAYAAIAKTGDKAACIYFGSGHEAAGKVFTPAPPPPIAAESAETEEATEVGLAEENELLQQIDQLKLEAANAEGDPAAAE